VDCEVTDAYIQTALQNVGTPHNVFNIAYHTGSPAPTDPFYQVNPTEVNARKTYYGASGVPYTRCDGGYCGFNVTNITNSINSRLAIASPLLLDLTATLEGNTLTVTCTAEASSSVSSGHVLHMVLLDQYTHLTTAPTGQEDFYHAMRDMAPSASGQSFTATAGGTTVRTATFTLSSSWSLDDLDIACFVQNTSSKSVLQAHCESVEEALEPPPPPPPPPPPANVILTPVNLPIQIPASGGSFSYTASLANDTTAVLTVDGWIMQQTPSGSWQGPMLGPVTVALPVGASVTRTRTQNVPSTAAAGTYTYRGYVGDYPAVKWDSSSFTYTKGVALKGPMISDGAGTHDGWACTGDLFPGELGGSGSVMAMPEETVLKAFPNPFNPTTIARYELRAASYVSLRVYDTAGREVAVLVDGWRDTGTHEVTFDASGLPSGIYFARLRAGEQTLTHKLMLVK